MKELIVVKHDTYGSGLTLATATFDNLSSLANGAICVFNQDPGSANYGKAVDLSKASPDTLPNLFSIAWGAGIVSGVVQVRMSQTIVKANAKAVSTAYAAPVAKQIQVGKTSSGDVVKSLKLPTLVAGQVAGLKTTDLSKPHYQTSRYRTYLYTVSASDTEATISAALIALVNADSKRIANAAVGYSGSTTSILLTEITAGKGFDVSKEGVLRDADITISVAHDPGQGTAAQIVDIEAETTAEDGQWDGSVGKIAKGYHNFTFPSQVDTTKNYNQRIIRHIANSQRNPIMSQHNVEQQVILALDSSLTAAATGNTMNGVANLITPLL